MRKTLTAIAAAVTIGAGVTIGGAGLASAVTQPAAATRPAHVRTLPSWAHWKTAPRGACSHGNGIVVWAGHGDGVLICSNGDTETS